MKDASIHLDSSILRAYDIRGTVGDSLRLIDAHAIGQAFATIANRRIGRQPKLCVAYDGRVSSTDLERELVKGMLKSGAQVTRLGLGPTPMLYFGVHALKHDGGIMITGSHNPANFNGFKLVLNGMPFWDDDIQYLGNLISDGEFLEGEGVSTDFSIGQDYVQRIRQEYKSNTGLSDARDPGNGASGEDLQRLVEQLPGEHLILNGSIDGTFPSHPPDPTIAENLEELISAVINISCDLGIGFDGDGDRIGVVDDKGEIIWGDQLLTLYAKDLLREMPGATVIADVKASLVFFEEVAAKGGIPVMWRTGHSPIKSKMRELNAPLAGEMSGHIFFSDRYYGFDDAIYAAVRLLDLVVRSQNPLSKLRESLPKTCHTPEIRIPCSDSHKFQIIEAVYESLAELKGIEVNRLDGVRVTTQDGWWLLRASNTQPVLVARCEGKTKTQLENLKMMLNQELKKHDIDLENLISS